MNTPREAAHLELTTPLAQAKAVLGEDLCACLKQALEYRRLPRAEAPTSATAPHSPGSTAAPRMQHRLAAEPQRRRKRGRDQVLGDLVWPDRGLCLDNNRAPVPVTKNRATPVFSKTIPSVPAWYGPDLPRSPVSVDAPISHRQVCHDLANLHHRKCAGNRQLRMEQQTESVAKEGHVRLATSLWEASSALPIWRNGRTSVTRSRRTQVLAMPYSSGSSEAAQVFGPGGRFPQIFGHKELMKRKFGMLLFLSAAGFLQAQNPGKAAATSPATSMSESEGVTAPVAQSGTSAATLGGAVPSTQTGSPVVIRESAVSVTAGASGGGSTAASGNQVSAAASPAPGPERLSAVRA